MALSSNNIKKIKEITEEFFQKMTIEAKVVVSAQQGQTFSIDLEAEDPQILIGEGGKTLNEIQYLLKAVLRKKLFSQIGIEEPFFIDLDIVDYKKKKYQYLRELARSLADEVALKKEEKTLPAMSPAERRIIHLELAEREDIATESIDQGPERRITIKPRS